MSPASKTCQSCNSEFVIESEDFAFYEKIQVPPPTWCPQCRMQRRMLWRNEIALSHRKSSLSGEDIISQYPADTPFPVYSIPEFFARNWEVPSADYDPNRGFFEQFHELQKKTPRRALLTDLQSIENKSAYQNAASRNKNCYLVFASGDNEDCIYLISQGISWTVRGPAELNTHMNVSMCLIPTAFSFRKTAASA